ncbi:1,4-dihydroxy-2-naphthoate octaprenyltransferase [Saccharothrix carnea]|uniref:1,4-dihydroxy-2-naphthoate octaprenyltransferase n=1 Tax=Saccharothrix carnea TaxID=1280637 RepID=A0A2P8IFJ2_SACCR|nr:UbiA family prenyltransferase [Saccharothrix carnea]PSL57238.1 1,4-dihydroxy-2-naphthoate octaprenyltransferase [Saccharothrix carnea]
MARGAVAVLRMCWVQARPEVQVVFALRFAVGGLVGADGGVVDVPRLLVGALVWACAVLAVYLLNGVSDAVEDSINKPTRPIPAGTLGAAAAIGVAAAASLLASLGALLVGTRFLVLTVVFLVLGCAYSVPPVAVKRSAPGSVAVVLAGGVVTYLAGFCAGGGGELGPVLVPAVALSCWMAGVGALAKDLSDTRGDRAAGRRTLAVRWGPGRTRLVVSGNALLVGVGFFVAVLWCLPVLVLPAGVVLVGALCVAARVGGPPYRVYMRTQHAAHVVAVAVLVVAVVAR